jgi:GYF domain 2
MASRSWFYASEGQQQGPYPEIQLHELIARGTITADTLVWSDGMAGWQRAGEIPGLISRGSGPPVIPQRAGKPRPGAGGHDDGRLWIDFGIWDFAWRSLVLLLGLLFIIPGPWALVWYFRWFVPCVQVPGRPNLGFTGEAMTVVPWYFGAIVLALGVGLTDSEVLKNLTFLVQMGLYWLFLKWLIANLSSNGQPLGLSFSGSFWAYLGWTVLGALAIFTIIGWAWVYVAALRWVCRNIQGTRREVIFVGTGLQFLWRAIVAVIGISFIIPIPWVYRWMSRWLASQTVLNERGAY